MDRRIEAIRRPSLVGRGSCSSIDECWGDEELADALNSEDIRLPSDAIKWALSAEGVLVHAACEARCGEDSDPQFAQAVEWEEQMARLELDSD
jgi:hypothetical protein